MKYGDTLRQRSIPEWGHYNIDYDYLKDLIKHHTTPGAGTALSIPGQGSTTERAFGDAFFNTLKAQHDRINLFVKSKSGEIERRLDYIGKQLAQLQVRQPSGASGSLPARTIEKYARIDADIAKVGEEIRSLSRFQVAQRTGFNKILKKYKRWTKDRELERRFRNDVTNSTDSFFQLDLGYLLDQYIDVLDALRATLEQSSTPSQSVNPDQPSSMSRLSKVIEEGSDVDFDVALTTIPLGPQGSRAVYWVHPDHIVELEILLLQHARLYTKTKPAPTSPSDSTQATALHTKPSIRTIDKYFNNGDDVGLIVLDEPAGFARRQNARTIDSIEEATGSIPARAAGNARWTSSGTAAVVVGLASNQHDKTRATKVKRKHLDAFLDPSTPFNNDSKSAPSEISYQDEEPTQDPDTAVQDWLATNDVKPMVNISSKRTRFLGLNNSILGGMWASLDREISMKNLLHENPDSSKHSDARDESSAFPHAVLEIRREGTQSKALIHILDRSHLVERVRGFSLETHAVWTCCKPVTMSPPTWVALLDQDIRKLPVPLQKQRRNLGSTTDSTSHMSASQTSASATSATSPYPSHNGETSTSDYIDPPPLRAFQKKRKSYSQIEAPAKQGYWNEYNDGESEEEGYYIYVDPNASVKMPGQELLEAWVRKTRSLLRLGKTEEGSGLLSTAEDGSSDEETGSESHNGFPSGYGTMAAQTPGQRHGGYLRSLFYSTREMNGGIEALNSSERENLLAEIDIRRHEREVATFQLYASCLGAAAVLDITLGILTTTSRRKLRGEVDRVIILGVVCNMLLLLVTITAFFSRKERLGWFHRGSVFLTVLAMVVVDVLLFRWALSV